MIIDVVPSTADHVDSLATKLRPDDVAELRAATGLSPRLALSISRDSSDWCMTVFLEDEPVAMFGVAPIMPGAKDVGTPWLLASPLLEEIRVRFLKECRTYIQKMHDRYPILTNWVDLRNTAALRWLEWCGFKPTKCELEYGYEKRPFMQYARFNDV